MYVHAWFLTPNKVLVIVQTMSYDPPSEVYGVVFGKRRVSTTHWLWAQYRGRPGLSALALGGMQ